MALMQWYPLNGDYFNRGRGITSATANSVAFTSTSKLGKSSMNQGTLTLDDVGTKEIFNNQSVSICFWIYPVNTNGGIIFGNENMTPPNNRKFSIFQYPTGNDLHWSWQNDDSNSPFTQGVITGCLPTTTWTHVCLTYENPNVTIYINGVKKGTSSGVSNSSFANSTVIMRASSNRYVQDLRIYNHCLSLIEVRNIARALVLHYDFENMYKEIEYIKSSGTQYINTGVFANQDTSIEVKSYTPTQTSTYGGTPAYLNVTANSNETYFYWNGYNTGLKGNNQDTSVTVYKQEKNKAYRNGVLVGTWDYTTWADNNALFLFGRNNNGLNDAGTTTIYYCKIWQNENLIRHFVPVMRTTDGVVGLYDKVNNVFYTNAGSGTFTSSEEIISNKIIDHSGNNYNGTLSNCTLVSDAKIGSTSLDTTTNNGYAKLPSIKLDTTFTIACWVKFINHNTWARIFDFGTAISGNDYSIGMATSNTDGLLTIFGRSGSGNDLPDTYITNLSLNTWYHLAMTINGTTLKFYLNGVLNKTITINSSIGGRIYSYNYLAKSNWEADGYSRKYINDFRIYNTVLSDVDINELYKTRIMVDDKGNVYCEGTSSSTSLNMSNTGLISANFLANRDYILLDYIESTGTQYIVTNVFPSTTTYSAEIKYQQTKVQSENESWALAIWNDGSWRCGGNTSGNNTGVGFTYSTEKATDVTIAKSSQNTITSSDRCLNLFGQGEGTNGVHSSRSYYKIFYCKIWNNGQLIRDFIPAKRKIDNEVGMLDIANNKFYLNEGSGTFEYTIPRIQAEIYSNTLLANNLYTDGGASVSDCDVFPYESASWHTVWSGSASTWISTSITDFISNSSWSLNKNYYTRISGNFTYYDKNYDFLYYNFNSQRLPFSVTKTDGIDSGFGTFRFNGVKDSKSISYTYTMNGYDGVGIYITKIEQYY